MVGVGADGRGGYRWSQQVQMVEVVADGRDGNTRLKWERMVGVGSDGRCGCRWSRWVQMTAAGGQVYVRFVVWSIGK